MMNLNLTKYKVLVAAMLAVALIIAGFSITSFSGNTTYAQADMSDKSTISVSGAGTVVAEPDIAYITFGVITEDTVAKVAQSENAMIMDKVMKALKEAGIAEKDMKTVNYYINPKYNYNKDTRDNKIVGYNVTNSVEVTVRDIENTGKVIDVASQAGVNVSNNIRFDIEDGDALYIDALKKAVGDAKGKAEAIASVIKVNLKNPLTINEGSNYYPSPIYAEYSKAAMDSSVATPVSTGTITIRAQVSVVYQY